MEHQEQLWSKILRGERENDAKKIVFGFSPAFDYYICITVPVETTPEALSLFPTSTLGAGNINGNPPLATIHMLMRGMALIETRFSVPTSTSTGYADVAHSSNGNGHASHLSYKEEHHPRETSHSQPQFHCHSHAHSSSDSHPQTSPASTSDASSSKQPRRRNKPSLSCETCTVPTSFRFFPPLL